MNNTSETRADLATTVRDVRRVTLGELTNRDERQPARNAASTSGGFNSSI